MTIYQKIVCDKCKLDIDNYDQPESHVVVVYSDPKGRAIRKHYHKPSCYSGPL